MIKSIFNYFWMGLLVYPLCFLIANEQSPYVTCHFNGQLGNQLFQIAATLAYAWDYGAQPLFPELHRTDYQIAYNRDHIFFRLDASPLPRPVQHIYEEHSWAHSPRIPYQIDHYLIGFFQSWKHFHHHRNRLLKTFAPSKSINQYLRKKYGKLLAHPNTVSVHVRTFHEAVHYGGCPFLGLSYYEKAMNLFPEDTLFVIFSDRINWCKHHFAQFHKNMVFIEDNDHIQDLFLMTKLKHHIISNSSFAWWGAYLNTNSNKKVVTPRYWLNPRMHAYPLPDSFLFPDWIVLDIDYEAPYPADIRAYDAYSKSLDTQ